MNNMEFKEIRRTDVYGFPRDVSVYALEKSEERMLSEFQSGKEKFKTTQEAGWNKRDAEGANNWIKLQKSTETIDPIIRPFIADMVDGAMYFEKYGIKTDFGNGFSVLAQPVIVTNFNELSLKLVPEFSFRHLESQQEFYCFPTLQKTDAKNQVYLEEAREVFHYIHPNQDGLKVPRLSRGGVLSVNAAHLMPQFIGSLRRLYKQIGLQNLGLLEQLTRARYDEERSGKRKIVLEAIGEKRQRIIRAAFSL